MRESHSSFNSRLLRQPNNEQFSFTQNFESNQNMKYQIPNRGHKPADEDEDMTYEDLFGCVELQQMDDVQGKEPLLSKQ